MKKYLFHLVIICFPAFWTSPLQAQDWERIQETDSSDVFLVAEHNGYLFAVADSSVYRYIIAEALWEPLPSIADQTGSFSTIFSYREQLYIGTNFDGVFTSSDNGLTWTNYNSGIPVSSRGIVSLTAIGDSLYLGSGYGGIFVRALYTDSAWSSYNTGLFQFGTNFLVSNDHALFASLGAYFFKRERGSVEWQHIDMDGNAGQYDFLASIASGEYVYIGTTSGVFKSGTSGENVTKTEIEAFPNTPVNSFAEVNGHILAAISYHNQYWIFSSGDYGDTWDFHYHEYAFLYSMFVFNNQLWASRSDGLWITDLGSWTGFGDKDTELPSSIILEQNYPNPFNPATRIGYSISEGGIVDLRVYDILGREILLLVNEWQSAGRHEINFDASGLPAGIYHYVLRVNNLSLARKATLLK